MDPVAQILAAGRKRVAVVGDPMLDVWVPVAPAGGGAEGPVVRRAGEALRTPGGAGNAARQLARWGCEAVLLGPSGGEPDACYDGLPAPAGFAFPGAALPVKHRLLGPDGRLALRLDNEQGGYGLARGDLVRLRDRVLKCVRHQRWDAVYLADYDKGVLDDQLTREVVRACQEEGVPCVADLKRNPAFAWGAVLKCNGAYADRWGARATDHQPAAVVTYSQLPPAVFGEAGPDGCDDRPWPPVPCVNHVGAGDCFGAHLALALACGVPLGAAARLAHAAGRAFVQHPHARPPWPHEVRRGLDPLGGKVVRYDDLDGLRQSLAGKQVVWTNGVFRLPHAGHAWLLAWARAQGDALVVGVNDDQSAAALRPGGHVRPLAERLAFLAAQGAADWVVPFAAPGPTYSVQRLAPAVLVKGHEYRGTTPPGAEHAGEVRFAPESPFPLHASDILSEMKPA